LAATTRCRAADVLDLRLHDGFAEAWPLLLPRLPAA
jgi:hypothetical protein